MRQSVDVTKCKLDLMQTGQNTNETYGNCNKMQTRHNAYTKKWILLMCNIYISCSHFVLFHFVSFAFSWICILLNLHDVSFAFCPIQILSHLHLLQLHYVSLSFCYNCIMSHLHFVKIQMKQNTKKWQRAKIPKYNHDKI